MRKKKTLSVLFVNGDSMRVDVPRKAYFSCEGDRLFVRMPWRKNYGSHIIGYYTGVVSFRDTSLVTSRQYYVPSAKGTTGNLELEA